MTPPQTLISTPQDNADGLSILRVHLQREGPFDWKEAKNLKDGKADRGLYQVYGCHPVYGADVLLYIGLTANQTFGGRLAQEKWWPWNQDSERLAIYVGASSRQGNAVTKGWRERQTDRYSGKAAHSQSRAGLQRAKENRSRMRDFERGSHFQLGAVPLTYARSVGASMDVGV